MKAKQLKTAHLFTVCWCNVNKLTKKAACHSFWLYSDASANRWYNFNVQDQNQDQDFENWFSRRLETEIQVSKTKHWQPAIQRVLASSLTFRIKERKGKDRVFIQCLHTTNNLKALRYGSHSFTCKYTLPACTKPAHRLQIRRTLHNPSTIPSYIRVRAVV